jgi:DNA helicase HerA-like ATPase
MVRLSPHGSVVLVAGTSGGGKSTAATGIVEHLAEREYQVCVIDPEGDYEGLPNAVTTGSADQPPSVEHVLQVLARPADQAVVNLLGLPIEDRRASSCPCWLGCTNFTPPPDARIGRGRRSAPHAGRVLLAGFLRSAHESGRCSLITVHPERIYKALLERVDVLIAVGSDATRTVKAFAEAIGAKRPGGHRDP